MLAHRTRPHGLASSGGVREEKPPPPSVNSLKSCGINFGGSLGQFYSTHSGKGFGFFQECPELTNVAEVRPGEEWTALRKNDGTVWTFGGKTIEGAEGEEPEEELVEIPSQVVGGHPLYSAETFNHHIGTLSAGLNREGSAITSLPTASGIKGTAISGAKIVTVELEEIEPKVFRRKNEQHWKATAEVLKGATSISVESQKPLYSVPAGTTVEVEWHRPQGPISPTMPFITQIATPGNVLLMLTAEHKVLALGNGTKGALGNGCYLPKKTLKAEAGEKGLYFPQANPWWVQKKGPVQTNNGTNLLTNVRRVSGGEGISFFLLYTGRVYFAAGEFAYAVEDTVWTPPTGIEVIDIDACQNYYMLLLQNNGGEVRIVGKNDEGVYGNGNEELVNKRTEVTPIEGYNEKGEPVAMKNVKQISVEEYSWKVMKEDTPGKPVVWTCGSNREGQQMIGSLPKEGFIAVPRPIEYEADGITKLPTPVMVSTNGGQRGPGATGGAVVAICFVDGSMRTAGKQVDHAEGKATQLTGALGNNTFENKGTPQNPGLTKVEAVACGTAMTFATIEGEPKAKPSLTAVSSEPGQLLVSWTPVAGSTGVMPTWRQPEGWEYVVKPESGPAQIERHLESKVHSVSFKGLAPGLCAITIEEIFSQDELTPELGELSHSLSETSVINTLPTTSLIRAIPSGSKIVTTFGEHVQLWTTTANAALGAKEIKVAGEKPNFAYPSSKKQKTLIEEVHTCTSKKLTVKWSLSPSEPAWFVEWQRIEQYERFVKVGTLGVGLTEGVAFETLTLKSALSKSVTLGEPIVVSFITKEEEEEEEAGTIEEGEGGHSQALIIREAASSGATLIKVERATANYSYPIDAGIEGGNGSKLVEPWKVSEELPSAADELTFTNERWKSKGFPEWLEGEELRIKVNGVFPGSFKGRQLEVVVL